jgi:hypothetical protein
MAARAKTPPIGTLAAILLSAAATSLPAPAASAQDAGQTVVNQVQLGDVFSTQTLTVDSAANGASAVNTAIANNAVATGSGVALSYQGTQELNAEAHGQTNVSIAGSAGPALYETTSATGNTSTVGTCCAITSGSSVQTIDAYHGVTAQSYAYVGDYTGTVSVDAAAVGNTQGWEPVNGQVSSTTTQIHYGTTDAETAATVENADTGSYSATAVANNVTTDASASSTDQTVTQSTDGYLTQANLLVNQSQGGDVTGAATATANNINVVADSGAANLDADQLSTKPVNATSTANIDNWSGAAASTAYGVANSAIVSNSGPATTMSTDQTASGPVTAVATLNGGLGGDAFVSATGVGNAVSGFACADCNGVVRASSTQSSAGGVSASASLDVGSVSSASGTASAVGNTASYVVKKPGS